MFRSSIVTKGKGFAPLKSTIDKYPQRFNAFARAIINEESPALITAMKEPGRKPRYPIDWQTLKQQAAFFATNGFGGGIPHIRTGRTMGSAFVRTRGSGNGLTIEAGYANDKAKFVVGRLFRRGKETQQRMFMGKWAKVEPKVERWRTKVIKRIVTELPDVFAATGAR